MSLPNQPLRSAAAADDSHQHVGHGLGAALAAGQPSIDENNPHHEPHQEHVIVSAFTNRLVLAILLFFTFATVGAANLESWIQTTFDILLPTWLNVFIALSIATVKAVLVVLYFMQLRFDNPINSVILCFSLFAFALFLGFTAIDLGSRGAIYEFKAREIIPGGSGETKPTVLGELQPGRTPVSESLTIYRTRQRIDQLTARFTAAGDPADVAKQKAQAEYQLELAEAIHHRKGGAHGSAQAGDSTPDTARPRSGVTTGLYDAKPAAPATSGGH